MPTPSGTSRPLSVSTTTTIAILTGAELRELMPDAGTTELVAAGAALALLVGIMLVVAGVLRLGFVANFISEPVLIGFKGAIAIVITLDQIPKLLGIHGKPRLLENRILEPMEAYGIKVMSIGFLVEEEAAMIWRGPMVMSAITQMLREVAWATSTCS